MFDAAGTQVLTLNALLTIDNKDNEEFNEYLLGTFNKFKEETELGDNKEAVETFKRKMNDYHFYI